VQVTDGDELPEGATREGRLDDPAVQGFEVADRRLPGDRNEYQQRLLETARDVEQA